MKLFPKFLIGVVVSAGGVGLLDMSPTPAVAQEAARSSASGPSSGQLSQVPLQSTQPSTIIARMSLRITELENEIRRLTGQNEELTHRLGQLEETFKKSVGDTALRLSTLEQGGGAAKMPPTGSPSAVTNAGSSLSVAPKNAQTTSGPVSGADKGAKVLGTLPGGKGTEQVARAVEPEAAAQAETPEQQYDRAHSLIVKQRKYGEAERVLRKFIDGNPKHSLASNAHYWLGRTYFVRADYENAAFAFAEGFQKFPDAEKAPANLLNLGMSLARLGKNREACTTYTRLLRTYKTADASIKRRITRERRRAKCRSR